MKPTPVAMALVALLVCACGKQPALVRQIQKVKLIDAIRQGILASAEAEKSAVLATTDEESRALALEAQRAAADINRQRTELHALVIADGRRDEIEKLDAFDAAWTELEDVDKRLLALAVANTNLKAARLAARDGTAALARFVDTLTEMQDAASDPALLRELSRGAVSAERVQALLLLHIPSADNGEMSRLEGQMRELSGDIDRILVVLRQNPQVSAEHVETAFREWGNFQRTAAEVIRLSRENTNVVSFDVSVHVKRPATRACLDALAALQAAVESGSHATR